MMFQFPSWKWGNLHEMKDSNAGRVVKGIINTILTCTVEHWWYRKSKKNHNCTSYSILLDDSYCLCIRWSVVCLRWSQPSVLNNYNQQDCIVLNSELSLPLTGLRAQYAWLLYPIVEQEGIDSCLSQKHQ